MKSIQIKNVSRAKQILSVVVITTLTFFSCQKNTSRNVEDKNNDKTTVVVNQNMQANELADAAEQLLSPVTFMLSYKTALMALEKDPSNLKAQFYSKLLKRFEVFRGYYNMILPLAPNEKVKAGLVQSFNNMPESPIKRFYGDKPFMLVNSAVDVQTLLDSYYAAINEFRVFLKDNQNSEMVINLNPFVFSNAIKENLQNSCVYAEQGSQFSVICDSSEVAIKKMNIADFIALRQMVSAELIYSIANSYSLNGLDQFRDPQLSEQFSNLSTEQKVKKLFSNSEFGKLREQNSMKIIKQIGSDLGSAVKWAMKYQNQLCPNPDQLLTVQRKGYLFTGGFCISKENQSSTEQLLETFDQALAGEVTTVDLEIADGSKKSFNVNMFAFFEKPAPNLRIVAPLKYNECGKVSEINDKTFYGTFIDANADLLLVKKCQ